MDVPAGVVASARPSSSRPTEPASRPRSACAPRARFAPSASSTRSCTASSTAFGAARPNANAAASCAGVATSPTRPVAEPARDRAHVAAASACPNISTSSRPETWNGTAPTPATSVSTPSASHAGSLLAHLVDRSDQPPDAERVEVDAAITPGGALRGHPLEPAREIALVLAAQRVEAERPPHRRRVAADAVARPVEHLEAFAVRVGRPGPARVPSVGVLGDEPSSRSPLPPTNTRGRGCCIAAGRFARRAARWYAPSNVNGPPGQQPLHDLDRLGQAPEADARARHRPCRSRRTRARTSRHRARRRAGRRTRGRAWPAPWPAPTPAAAPRRARACRAARRAHAAASAASVTIGSKHASRSGAPPYFARSRNRWSESQTES